MKHTLVILVFAAGCSFNPGKSSTDFSVGGGDDMMSDGGGGDMGPGGPDLAMICAPGNKTCSNGTLSTCNLDGTGVDTSTCVLGCNAANNDCQALQPTPPAVSSDFSYQGLSELVIAASQTLLVFDTDTGAIVDGAGAVVRMANATPMMRNVENGIGFHRTAGVGIWTFSKLTVPATTTIVFKSPYAASILSSGDLTIAGTIDARGYADPTKALMTGAASTLCQGTVAGPGGTIGGTMATVAMGTGAGGAAPDPTTGGGGAGYGDVGGAGGKNGGTNGGNAGVMAGMAAINPLAAGFGGGASGGPAGVGDGGGGGGAVQLAAEGTLTISGKINAGGCGGAPGDATHGGGGGGSGGAILLESATVHVTSSGVLTANGGGGGGGGDPMTTAGAPGGFGSAQAAGGMPGNNGAGGGQGGSVNSTNGDPGSNGKGGGGGGGVGRVRLNSRTGATLDMTPIISPAPTQGTVTIQ